MDLNNVKRKNSQDIIADGPDHKIRKVNTQENTLATTATPKSTVTARFVELWEKGIAGVTQEGRDNSPNKQEIEGKYRESVKLIEHLKKKLIVSQEQSREILISMKEKTSENETLRNKITKAGELTHEFSQVVEYISDTLDRNKVQFKDLMYIKNLNEVLKNDKSNLKNELNKLNEKYQVIGQEYQQIIEKKELEWKSKFQEIESQVTRNCEKKISDMLKIEKKMEKTIEDLTKSLNNEKSTAETRSTAIKEECEKILSEVRKNLVTAENEIKNLREEKEKMTMSWEDKEKSTEVLEKKVAEYEAKLKKLLEQLNEAGLNLKKRTAEKSDIQKKMEEKDIDLLRLIKDINSITLEKKLLNEEVEELNEKLKNEERERIKISDDLAKKYVELQESQKRNRDLEAHYSERNESKDSMVSDLKKELNKLKKDLENSLAEKNHERQEANKARKRLDKNHEMETKDLQDKYDKCLADYYKATNAQNDAVKKNLESRSNLKSVTNDLKVLKEEYSKKIEETDKKLAEKSQSEVKLKEELLKLKTYLAELERKNNDIVNDREKENEHHSLLERKIKNLDAMVKNLTPPQEIATKAKTGIHIHRDEIFEPKSLGKPILKAQISEKNLKSPGKKIQFNFSNDHDNNQYAPDYPPRSQPALKTQEKIDELQRTPQSQPSTPPQNIRAQPGTPATTPRKFFKSRGTPKK